MFPRNHLRYARSSGSAKAVRSRRSCFSTSWTRPFRQPRQLRTSVNRRRRNLREKNIPFGAKGPQVIRSSASSFSSDAQVQAQSECSFCVLFVRTLEKMLPKERTEVKNTCSASTNPQLLRWLSFCVLQSAVIDVLEEVCSILPSAYHSQCQALVGKISKTVLDAILSYATPQAICSLLHMCKGQEAPLFGQWTNKCSMKLCSCIWTPCNDN